MSQADEPDFEDLSPFMRAIAIEAVSKDRRLIRYEHMRYWGTLLIWGPLGFFVTGLFQDQPLVVHLIAGFLVALVLAAIVVGHFGYNAACARLAKQLNQELDQRRGNSPFN